MGSLEVLELMMRSVRGLEVGVFVFGGLQSANLSDLVVHVCFGTWIFVWIPFWDA